MARLTGEARRGSCRTQWLLRVEGGRAGRRWRRVMACSRVTFSPDYGPVRQMTNILFHSTGRVFTSYRLDLT